MNAMYRRIRFAYFAVAALLCAALALALSTCDHKPSVLSLTAGTIPKATGAATLGDSHLTDDGTTVATTGRLQAGDYRYAGVPVIGPSGVLYSGASSLTIADTVLGSNPPGPGVTTIDLTAEGTLDWYRLNQAVQFGCAAAFSAKAFGGTIVKCDSFTLLQGGSVIFQTTDSAISFVAGTTDTTDGVTSGVGRFLGVQSGPTTAPWGWRYVLANATTSQRVVRVYWAESQVATATCTATLPDGTTASHVWTGTDGVVTYHRETFTYTTSVPGNVIVSCVVNARQVAGVPILDSTMITVGVI